MSNPRTFDRILKRPVVSEKSYSGMAVGRYVFRCEPTATRVEIRHAVEEAFGVVVVGVNVMNVRGKRRLRSRRRQRIVGSSPSWKKAIVTLRPGEKIEGLFEGV